jgi:hypothetical protein
MGPRFEGFDVVGTGDGCWADGGGGGGERDWWALLGVHEGRRVECAGSGVLCCW